MPMKQKNDSIKTSHGSSVYNINENHEQIKTDGIGGWKKVQKALPRIILYGKNEGILQTTSNSQMHHLSYVMPNILEQVQIITDSSDHRSTDIVQIPCNDITIIHAAIPFLPIPVATLCFFLNIIIPGSGTILSGISALCMGQPRINFKEGRKLVTVFVNFLVGISQFFTITFLFVGWFWSVAWGALLIIHSMQYRDALVQRRQDAVATVAIEAITKDSILHRRNVKKLIEAHHTIKTEQRLK